jgi:hypothetical protein
MTKATSTTLEELHGELARQLAAKIKSGEATAADLNVARQFLKDNGIDAVRQPANPLDDLAKTLPFLSAESIADDEHTIQ